MHIVDSDLVYSWIHFQKIQRYTNHSHLHILDENGLQSCFRDDNNIRT